MSAAVFAARFQGLLGAARVAQVLSAMSDRPGILLAGDPGVGKSTVAKALAARLGGDCGGTGASVRAAAAERRLSLADFNALLAARPEEDFAIDARAASVVARGDHAVFESRMTGHIGRWLGARGRSRLVTVYLRCEAPEQAVRLAAREDPSADRGAIEWALRAIPTSALDACARTLRGAGAAVAGAAAVVEREAARLTSERARMWERYGVELDDPSVYDLVVDTTALSVDATVTLVEAATLKVH